jgi:OPT family oligopeptide transporter
VLLLISHPFGRCLAIILPDRKYSIPLPHLPLGLFPSSLGRGGSIANRVVFSLACPRSLNLSFNPGPWNIKEHVLVYIMANVSIGSPYALNAIVVSEVFYGLQLGYWFSLTLVLATQLTGFGLAGLCRRFLVWPASMVWPQNLVGCALLNTLHSHETGDDGIGMFGEKAEKEGTGMSRYRFFMIATVASFVWYFLPGTSLTSCRRTKTSIRYCRISI